MDKITAVELLREVLLGERRDPLPPNSVQRAKQLRKQATQAEKAEQDKAEIMPIPAAKPATTASPATPPRQEPNYISDNEDSKAEEDWSMD